MRVERRSIAIQSCTQSTAPSPWFEDMLMALGALALSRQVSLSTEGLLLMAQDLQDVPWEWLAAAIHGWRRGTLRMGRPAEMDRFPTVRQLRLQAELLRLEGE
jgi:hypothetical protein